MKLGIISVPARAPFMDTLSVAPALSAVAASDEDTGDASGAACCGGLGFGCRGLGR